MNYTQHTSTRTSKQHDGYPALADFIAQDPDHETLVFRKFKRLAVRNILHLQAELLQLEAETDVLEQEAAASTDLEVHLARKSLAVMNENARKPGRELEHRQRELAHTLDIKLKMYC